MSDVGLFQRTEPSCSRTNEVCHNGCCQSSPCENGGTCHEVCDVRARRYKCACPSGYCGHRCHKKLQSCYDILLSGRHTNGIYQIVNVTNGVLNVYCDFESEPGGAWTLVQSYSLEKGQRGSEKDIFSDKPLFQDFPVNESLPSDWSSYRLSLADMQFIRSQSTHWRATCDFTEFGVNFRDYLRASFDAFDVMVAPSDVPPYTRCRPYDFINIRGNQCINCTVFTITHPDYPLFILSGLAPGECDFDSRPNRGKSLEFNFGYYSLVNPAFRCSVNNDSTTQFWFGKM